MTEAASTPPAENVARGAALALVAIPAAIAIFAVLGWIGFFVFVAPVVVPGIALWLYEKGAGASLTRRGWAPVIGISLVAVTVGVLAGQLAGALAGIGGNLGRFLPVIGTTLRYQIAEQWPWLLVGVGLGVVGLIIALRGPRAPRSGSTVAEPEPEPAVEAEQPTATQVEPAPDTAAPKRPHQGVVLNGEPIDPEQPR